MSTNNIKKPAFFFLNTEVFGGLEAQLLKRGALPENF